MTTTTKLQHTAGPWVAENFDHYVREEQTGATVARICKDDGHLDAKVRQPMPHDANARLIAAAPELYEALKAIIGDRRGVPGEMIENARAALAKVTENVNV